MLKTYSKYGKYGIIVVGVVVLIIISLLIYALTQPYTTLDLISIDLVPKDGARYDYNVPIDVIVTVDAGTYTIDSVKAEIYSQVGTEAEWSLLFFVDLGGQNLNTWQITYGLGTPGNGSYGLRASVFLAEFPNEPLIIAHSFKVGESLSIMDFLSPSFEWVFILVIPLIVIIRRRQQID